jgi:D-alanyl-D-alanine carboxypeptidase
MASHTKLRGALQAILGDFIARGIVGASLTVIAPNDEQQVLCAGLADRGNNTPVRPDHLFKIGSCTKPFVAATLLSLAQDGAVALEAPIARWFAKLPNGEHITVRDLIAHTAGLPEFEYDLPMDWSRQWTPQALVDFAFQVRTPTEPGVKPAYSNTGYVLAGMLIEALSGDTLAGQIRKRLLTPLGLRNIFAAAGEPFPAERLVRGYYHRPPPAPGAEGRPVSDGGEMWRTGGMLGYSQALQDSTNSFPFTAAYAAGDMVGTSEDLATFLRAAVTGRLLSSQLTAELVDRRRLGGVETPATRMREAGAGVWAMHYAGRTVLGHQGSMPGYVAVMVHDRAQNLTAALTTNTGSGNRLSFYASGLHEVIDAVLTAAAANAP